MKQLLLILTCALAMLPARAAKVDTIAVPATYIESPMNVIVMTPDVAAQGQKCPTVYLLHGYGGDLYSWSTITRKDFDSLADQYGIVIVFPDGRNSWYWDSPEHPEMKMESFFTKELVPYIDANYPTIADPRYRAISGLSMGGHGALWLAMRHSDIWGNAGSTSGGVNIMPFAERWKMAFWLGPQETNRERWEQSTVINLVPTLKPGQLNIIFDCGTEDFFAKVNNELHQALLDAKIDHDYISRPGNHSHKYWSNSILYHLLYYSEAFKKAAAADKAAADKK